MGGDRLPPPDHLPNAPTVAAPNPLAAPLAGSADRLRASVDPLAGPLPLRFGRYTLLKLLGKGGMGSVYLARDTQLNRHVALKVPHFNGPERFHLRDRFLREARVAATLAHPNLCPVYDCGEIGGVLYLTMAYLEGKQLAKFIRPDQPLPPRAVATVVRQLALAMAESHAKGIIHRDLKPTNIMITPKKQAVIMDFGLARRTDEGEQHLTQSGLLLGTPAYMPPEQLNSDARAMGPATDIYALGVMLYELLAGRPPFQGPLGSLMSQIMTAPPPSLSRWRAQLDPALDAICARALAKKPADRFPSMQAFAAALEDYLRGRYVAPASDTETVVERANEETGSLDERDAAKLFRVMAQEARPSGAVEKRTRKSQIRRLPTRRRKIPDWLFPLSLGTFTLLCVGVGLWAFFHHLDNRASQMDGWAWDPVRIQEQKLRWQEARRLQTALDRWRANPDDELPQRELDDWLNSLAGKRTDLPAETNIGLGQYLIVKEHRWSEGLRRLAFSGDGPWFEAADLDLLAATLDVPATDAAATWVRCGDTWWELSDDVAEPDVMLSLVDAFRTRLRERAALWYKKALPVINEAEAIRISERLRQVAHVE
jgi:serine/threonine protein kinase